MKEKEIAKLLALIKVEIDDLISNPNSEHMSPEEIVALGTEIVLSGEISSIEYTSPIGEVDRSGVSFMPDEELDWLTYEIGNINGDQYEE